MNYSAPWGPRPSAHCEWQVLDMVLDDTQRPSHQQIQDSTWSWVAMSEAVMCSPVAWPSPAVSLHSTSRVDYIRNRHKIWHSSVLLAGLPRKALPLVDLDSGHILPSLLRRQLYWIYVAVCTHQRFLGPCCSSSMHEEPASVLQCHGKPWSNWWYHTINPATSDHSEAESLYSNTFRIVSRLLDWRIVSPASIQSPTREYVTDWWGITESLSSVPSDWLPFATSRAILRTRLSPLLYGRVPKSPLVSSVLTSHLWGLYLQKYGEKLRVCMLAIRTRKGKKVLMTDRPCEVKAFHVYHQRETKRDRWWALPPQYIPGKRVAPWTSSLEYQCMVSRSRQSWNAGLSRFGRRGLYRNHRV